MATRPSETLHFSGSCSISTIEQHRQTLLQAFATRDAIAVDLSAVDGVDVSFVQLILSAARTAATRRTPFAILNTPDAVAASFRGAGIDVERPS